MAHHVFFEQANTFTNLERSAITTNTAKTGISSGQTSAITANTAKTGISSGQTSAITANTAKVSMAFGTSSTVAAQGNLAMYQSGGTMTGDLNITNQDINITNTTAVATTGGPTIKIERGTLHLVNADGTGSNDNKMGIKLHSKRGQLPGNTSAYFPVVESQFSNLYFVTTNSGNGTRVYCAYIGNNNVGQLDFTGQHRCIPKDLNLLKNLSDNIGKIVCSSGVINSLVLDDDNNIHRQTKGKHAITINEACPEVELCNSFKSKSVFGVISGGEDEATVKPNGEKHYNQGAFNSVFLADEDDNRVFINSVGEGAILVCNNKGNIINGDYLTSSSISKGYGCKQGDNILHNYTVAKSTMSCAFDLHSKLYNCYEIENDGETHLVALIACTYHCG